MASLPILLMSAFKKVYCWTRKIAYDDMARQAYGWVPDDLLIRSRASQPAPLQLDFEISRKHRLKWAHQRVKHSGH